MLVARPWFIVSFITLVLNDWLLKPALGNIVTGKLSDIAGLALVTFVLSQVAAMSGRRWPAGVLTVGISLFVATKCLPSASIVVESLLDAILPWSNQITPDPTDVAALAIVPVAWWRGQRVSELQARSGWTQRRSLLPRYGLGATALLACCASSYSDTAHWLRVDGDGDVEVYEYSDTAAYLAGPVPFDPGSVGSDGSWTGPLFERSDLLIGDADLEPGEVSCQGSEPQHCVASPDSLSIIETFDRGDTWMTVWKIDSASKYADQQWVDSKYYHLERYEGVRQLVIADDGMVVAIFEPDRFVSRSPGGVWSLDEPWFRPIPNRVIVQLFGGFVLLALVGAKALQTIPKLDWRLSRMGAAIFGVVVLGQPWFLSPVAIALLGAAGIVLVVSLPLGGKKSWGDHARAGLRCVVVPAVVTIVGILLVLDWQTNGGTLGQRLLVHLGLVLAAWALSALWDWLRKAPWTKQVSPNSPEHHQAPPPKRTPPPDPERPQLVFPWSDSAEHVAGEPAPGPKNRPE